MILYHDQIGHFEEKILPTPVSSMELYVVDATVTLTRTHPLDRPIVAAGAREHPDRETQDSERHSARMQKGSKRAAR